MAGQPWVIVLGLGLGLGLAACQGTPDLAPGVPMAGDPAPDFALSATDGGPRRLAELYARGPVLVWFTNLCETCQSRGNEIQAAADEMGAQALAVVPPDLPAGDVEAFNRRSLFRFPRVVDADGRIREAYQAPVTPDT